MLYPSTGFLSSATRHSMPKNHSDGLINQSINQSNSDHWCCSLLTADDGVRVGMISYARTAKHIFSLGGYNNHHDVKKLEQEFIEDKDRKGGTFLDLALDMVREKFDQEGRKVWRHFMLICMDIFDYLFLCIFHVFQISSRSISNDTL